MIEELQLYLETYLGTSLGRPDVSYEGQRPSTAVYWGGCLESVYGPEYRIHNIVVQFKHPSTKEYVDANEINEIRGSALELLDWLHAQTNLVGWLIYWPNGGPYIVANPEGGSINVNIPVCLRYP